GRIPPNAPRFNFKRLTLRDHVNAASQAELQRVPARGTRRRVRLWSPALKLHVREPRPLSHTRRTHVRLRNRLDAEAARIGVLLRPLGLHLRGRNARIA